MTPAHAVHPHSVELRRGRAPRPAARHQVDRVAASPAFPRQPPEDLVQVDLRAARVRVLPVVPVDDAKPHSAPNPRATAPRTPFTTPAPLAPANHSASFTA